MQQLKAVWKQHGAAPHFYDRYYLPKAQELTAFRVGPAAMPIFERKNGRVVIRSLNDGWRPAHDGKPDPFRAHSTSGETLRAIAGAPGLEPSPVAVYYATHDEGA